jgi:NACHT domain
MAELAAASSVGGLLSLTIQVIQISQRYVSGVSNASKTIKGYFRELEVMRLVLEDLKSSTRDSGSCLELDSFAFMACSQELETLRSKLCKRTNSNSSMSHLSRLTWPFAEDETRRLTEVLNRYQSSLHVLLSAQNHRLTAATLAAINTVNARQEQDIRERIAEKLSISDPLFNHVVARDKHEPATGDWFLRSVELAEWSNNASTNLWIRSIPGAGKTVLCSTIIDHLLRNQRADDFVLFFYFDFQDDNKQDLASLLRSLIAQICVRSDHVPENVQTAFEAGSVLDTRSLEEMFTTLATECGHVKVVIDAIDESSDRPKVLAFLEKVAKGPADCVQWLATSRRERDIEVVLADCKPLLVTLGKEMMDADIRLHIEASLLRDRKLSSRPAWVKQRITETLLEKANGMFQYVQCQLNVLRHCLTGPATEDALLRLPVGIDETYDRMLLSIHTDNWGHVRRALTFVVFSKRPMRVEEVAEAAVLPSSTRPFDPEERLFDPEDIVMLAAGLILCDESSRIVSLAHYSVQEYLLSSRILDGPANYFGLNDLQSNYKIAETSMSYILSIADFRVDSSLVTEEYPLLKYACQHWLEHAHQSLHRDSSIIFNLLLHFVDGRKNSFGLWLTHYTAEQHDYQPALESLFSTLSPKQILTVLRSPGFMLLPDLDLSAKLIVERICSFALTRTQEPRITQDSAALAIVNEPFQLISLRLAPPNAMDPRKLLNILYLYISTLYGVASPDWDTLGKFVTVILSVTKASEEVDSTSAPMKQSSLEETFNMQNVLALLTRLPEVSSQDCSLNKHNALEKHNALDYLYTFNDHHPLISLLLKVKLRLIDHHESVVEPGQKLSAALLATFEADEPVLFAIFKAMSLLKRLEEELKDNIGDYKYDTGRQTLDTDDLKAIDLTLAGSTV